MIKKYEAAVYNEDVLNALKEGEHHKNLDDNWADTHYFDIEAASLDDAWEVANRKWRSGHGFVIKAIEETSS